MVVLGGGAVSYERGTPVALPDSGRPIVFTPDVDGIVAWLVFKAHRLVYHSTLGWRVIMKKEEENCSMRQGN